MKTILLFSTISLLSFASCSYPNTTSKVEAKDLPGFFAKEEYRYMPKDIYVPLFRDPFWFLKRDQTSWKEKQTSFRNH